MLEEDDSNEVTSVRWGGLPVLLVSPMDLCKSIRWVCDIDVVPAHTAEFLRRTPVS